MGNSFNKFIYFLAAAIGFIIMVKLVLYFIGNTLVNLIGVPLAAYHSYEAWQESAEPMVVVEQPVPAPFIIYQYLLSSFIILRLIFVFFFSRELRRFKFKHNKLKWIWLFIIAIFGTLGYILYLVYRKVTRIPRQFNPQFKTFA